MRTSGVRFSIAGHAAWAPGLTTDDDWALWAQAPYAIGPGADPAVRQMPAMLRRRAGLLGKMALEVAYQCLDGRSDVPTVFCSRHGETARAVELLADLAHGEPLSPTAFSMAVHNASAGLFSIARADRANHIALAAGTATIEHAVIEACGLLADGAPMVLLVACDCPLPPLFAAFDDSHEQPHAWAWLMVPAGGDGDSDSDNTTLALHWAPDAAGVDEAPGSEMPGGLEVLRFYASGAAALERVAARRRWRWSRDA